MHLPVGGLRFDASGRIWGCSGSEIQVSADEGRTWTQKATPVTSPDSLFQVLPGPANVVFAVTSLRGLFRSTDEGATWTLVNYTVYGKIAAPCGIHWPLVSMSPRVPSRSIRWSGDEGATWRDFDVFNVFDISFGPRCSPIVARDIASDIWISKFTADGRTQLWQTIIGGGAADSTVWSEGAGLITDVAGNLYLVGHTASTDFPDQHFGTDAQSGYFVSKLDPDGALVFTTLLPGITVAAITTDRAGNVVAVGTVSSDSVPVTADADQPEFMGTYAGFVLRLSLSGQVVYASYFNQGALNVALAFQDRVLLGGSKFPGESRQHFLGELLEDGRIHDLAALPGSPVSIAADATGQLAVAGVIPALNSCSFFADFPFKGREGGDLYIARFQGPDFKPSPVKSITSDCQSRPQAVAFRSDGVLVLLASTLAFTFPLKQPLFTGFASGFSRGESTVLVYLDTNNGMLLSTYAYGDVLTANDTAFTADIRELTAWPVDIESPAIRLDNVVNAFSGKGSSVLPGSLVTLSGTNLGPVDTIDLGLNSRTDLPKELGGTRVLFNGRPAPIFATSWSRIVCVAPYGLVGEVGIQVEFEGMRSNPVVTAVGGNFGLLTRNFPDLPSSWKSVQEGNVRNADDTPNSAGNPARPGSTFYVFATGFTSPQVEPGSIATSEVASEGFVYAPGFSADTFGQVRGATTIPGFVTALFRVPLTAPSTPGRHEVHLDTVWYKHSDHSASNPIWVYVK